MAHRVLVADKQDTREFGRLRVEVSDLKEALRRQALKT